MLEPLAGGVLEPLAAPPEGAAVEPLVEPLPLVAPPEAESFFAASVDEALEEDDGLLGVAPEALEDEEGELGVAPAALEELESFLFMSTDAEPDVELEPDGALAEPDGVVVEPAEEDEAAPGLLAARSPALSPHAVSRLAPKTIDTATAKVESLIDGPPWLG